MADFIDDSKASLQLRNYYLNRDFRQDGAKQAKAAEWAQGFVTRFESGFTEGPIGLGLDAIGELGVKLDSSSDRRGTGLLPFGPTSKEPVDEYSELGLTAKLRVDQNVLRLGTLQPWLPVVIFNDTRLLPSTFQGGMLTSQALDGLTFDGGRLTQANPRDSSAREKIGFGSAISDAFDFAGGSWATASACAPTCATSTAAAMAKSVPAKSTTATSTASLVSAMAGTGSVPAGRSSPATAASHRSMAAPPMSSTWSPCMTSPMPTRTPGSCAMTTTLPRWACPGCPS